MSRAVLLSNKPVCSPNGLLADTAFGKPHVPARLLRLWACGWGFLYIYLTSLHFQTAFQIGYLGGTLALEQAARAFDLDNHLVVLTAIAVFMIGIGGRLVAEDEGREDGIILKMADG